MSDRWQQNFDDVFAYIKEHNCEISDIPYDVTTSNGITMQNWLKEQYMTFLGRSGRPMSEERRAILRDFGIENFRNKFDNEFYHVLMDVKHFYDENQEGKIKKGVTFGKTTGIDLSAWVQFQRRKYKAGKLKQRYLAWIMEADLMFILENPFDLGYRHALDFLRVYGDLQMPVSFVCEDGFHLGKWCVAMRDRRNRNQAAEEQIKKLDEIGFDWRTAGVMRKLKDAPSVLVMSKLHTELEDRNGFIHTEQYFSEHKSIDVPEAHICDDGFSLGKWLEVLRFRYRSKGVPSEILEKLQGMGFKWNIINAQSLSEQDKTGLACAAEYSSYYHHLNVSENYTSGDFPLGEWITNARTRYNSGTLPAELNCRLQELSIIWDSSDIKWFYNFVECRKFIQAHPDTPIPRELVSSSGTMLNLWYRHNRRAFEDDKLSPVRGKLFSEIAASSEQIQKNNARMLWDKHWYDVKQYLEQHPEYTVSSFPSRIAGRHISNVSAWLKVQIKEYFSEDSKLDEDQREKLRQLGIDDSLMRGKVRKKERDNEWRENCMKLKAFYEEHGHINLPKEYFELKKWFLQQRGCFNRGIYSEERMTFLTENGINELFKMPLRGNKVKLNVTITKEHYDALMQKIGQEGCQSIEEYLIKLAKS